MRIEQATVAMSSDHAYSREYEYAVESTISFRSVFAGVDAGLATAATPSTAPSTTTRDADRQAQLLLLLQQLIGRVLDLLDGQTSVTDLRQVLSPAAAQPAGGEPGAPRAQTVMTWTHSASERIDEHERSNFASTGQIVTADGRALDFSLALAMCRDFSCTRTATEAGAVVLRDPLVINFAGNAADLSGKTFAFDLDADGQRESVHQLAAGSGYLAIDRNGDGCINDGSELFGACSGDGFADLAALDGDGNRWLDEADAAFSTLRVWQRDANGASTLSSLAQSGVGALYLGSAATPFALTDDANRLLGEVRASGIYVGEDGRSGTLQQLDLAVESPPAPGPAT